MALNLKSNNKPAAKKAVVGKSKKKTVWWKKVFIGSSVAVLMLSVGFSGYTWWQNKQVKAHAAGYRTLASWGSNAYISACRISGTTIVRYLLVNNISSTLQFDYRYYTYLPAGAAGGNRISLGYGYAVRDIATGSSSVMVGAGIISGNAWVAPGVYPVSVGSLPSC